MSLNKLLTEIEERCANRRFGISTVVPRIKGTQIMMRKEEVELLLEICKRQREALRRYETLAVPVNDMIYDYGTIARGCVADCDALAEKGGE